MAIRTSDHLAANRAARKRVVARGYARLRKLINAGVVPVGRYRVIAVHTGFGVLRAKPIDANTGRHISGAPVLAVAVYL